MRKDGQPRPKPVEKRPARRGVRFQNIFAAPKTTTRTDVTITTHTLSKRPSLAPVSLLVRKQRPKGEPDNSNETLTLRLRQLIRVSLRIGEGSSDPFNSMAIPVSAQINEILSFGRDVFLPALHHTQDNKVPTIAKQNWQEAIRQLRSEGSACGIMSYYSTAIAVATGSSLWARTALAYQVKCASLLRCSLVKADPSQYADIYSQVLGLFGCEILSGRLSEAKVHSKILQTLFDICTNHTRQDSVRLWIGVYRDRNLSILLMARTSFDMDVWVPRHVTKFWNAWSAPFPHLYQWPRLPLDKALSQAGSRFASIMNDTRDHYYRTFLTQQKWSQANTPSDVAVYLHTRLIWLESRLINHYVDVTDVSSSEVQSSPKDLWPQAYTCLAILFMSHNLLHTPTINGVRLIDTTPIIRKYLQRAILEAEQACDRLSQRQYSNTLLWTLFVGASAERLSDAVNVDESWFDTRLRDQLLTMGLTNWTDLRKIILGFPCAPEILSQDVSWVDNHMKTVYETDGMVRTNTTFRTYDEKTGGFR